MPNQVCTGAVLKCSFGLAPSTFVATPKMVMTSSKDAGNILDHKPIANVPPFGMCTTQSNPAVAAATAAALGTPTPSACIPVLPAPWVTGALTVLLNQSPALDDTCKLMCAYGGVITVASAGQLTHQIP